MEETKEKVGMEEAKEEGEELRWLSKRVGTEWRRIERSGGGWEGSEGGEGREWVEEKKKGEKEAKEKGRREGTFSYFAAGHSANWSKVCDLDDELVIIIITKYFSFVSNKGQTFWLCISFSIRGSTKIIRILVDKNMPLNTKDGGNF